MLAAGAAAAAVCGVHSPLNPSQELAFAAELQAALQQRAPGEDVLHVCTALVELTVGDKQVARRAACSSHCLLEHHCAAAGTT
jgi:hypothetical protein